MNVPCFAPDLQTLTLLFELQLCFFRIKTISNIQYILCFRFHSLYGCCATGGENQALPPPEGEAGVHPAVGPGGAAVLCV